MKRFRASAGAFGEEKEQACSGYSGKLVVGAAAAPTDRTVWGLQPQAEGWSRRRRCSHTRRDGFEGSGAAGAAVEVGGQTGIGAAPSDAGTASLSLAPRGLTGAAAPIPPPAPRAGGHDRSPFPSADRRYERGKITRSNGGGRGRGRGRDGGEVQAMAEEEEAPPQVGGNNGPSTAAAATTAYQAADTATTTTHLHHHYQEEQGGGESYDARGSSAKKPRYHRLHRKPSAGQMQMDTLTDGVGSLGVASPRATAGDGSGGDKRGEEVAAADAFSRRRGYVSRRATLIGSTGDAFLPEPVCAALSAVGGGGQAGPRAARVAGAGAGAGVQGCAMTRRQKAQSGGAAVGGGPGQHQSKRRRNGSLAAGASSFR